ncbi:MAG: hypothetical protein LKI94_07980 [Sporolactobacillus sp.]|jgi:hypothetical protein|nr:hypothetical protein [Sporolactobacillus sp.]
MLGKKPLKDSSERPFFSWHANVVTLNRRKALVLINDSNYYVLVLYGLRQADCQKLYVIYPKLKFLLFS